MSNACITANRLQLKFAKELQRLDRLAHGKSVPLSCAISWWAETAMTMRVKELPGMPEIDDLAQTRHLTATRSVRSARNTSRAAAFITTTARTGYMNGIVADSATAKELHLSALAGILDDERLGSFRTTPISMWDPRINGIANVGLPADQLDIAMSTWSADFSRQNMPDIHPVVRSGLAHLEFCRIHPFPDGNGRTSRLLIAGLHAEQGFPDLPFNLVFERDRMSSNANITDALKQGDPEIYLHWHIQAMERAAEAGMAMEPGLEAVVGRLAEAISTKLDPGAADAIGHAMAACPISNSTIIADISRVPERDVREALWLVESRSSVAMKRCTLGDINVFVNFDAMHVAREEIRTNLGPDLVEETRGKLAQTKIQGMTTGKTPENAAARTAGKSTPMEL